jgi:hypothetical protein
MANTKIPIELSSTPSIVDNGDATAITIDSSERVIVGQTAIATGFENFAQLETSHASAGGLVINTQTASTSNYGRLIFTKGNASGNEGLIRYNTGDYHMSFWTAATQRLRLDSDGLKFGSDTAAANALDDYEEGTFSGTTDGSAYSGTYTKIGRICHVSFESDNSSSTGVSIAVMPFSAKAGTPVNGSQPTFNTSNTNDNVYVAIYNGGSTAYIYSRTGSTQSVTTGSIFVNFVYETD